MAKRSFAKIGVSSKRSTFFVVLAIILLATVVAFFGLTVPVPGQVGLTRLKGAPDIRFGIDIRGGVEAVFTPRDYDGHVTPEQMDAASRVLNQRLDSLQILDREVIVSSNSDRITVRYPWRSDEVDFNPEQALKELGEMALLTFRAPNNDVLLTGADVSRASFSVDQRNNSPVVALELNAAGAAKFEAATRQYIGQQIGIYMDEQLLSDPVVQTAISGGQAIIEGRFTPESATDLAQKINAGALPFALQATSSSTISPMLGQDSLRVMVMAGATAFILICLFMLLYYRLPGLVACLSLLAQISGILLAISIPQQTLTLQGIAGIILSIGMGVDANVIIAERIKEEIRGGAPLRLALSNGFERAFSAVWDGNVTVAIAAVVLMVFGSGTMLSFGYSLLVGVILNAVTGVWLSRLMIGSLASYRRLQSKWLYGGFRERAAAPSVRSGGFGFYRRRKLFFGLSLALILAGILLSFTLGVDLDIQFKGGSLVTYQYSGEVNLADAEAVAGQALGQNVTAQTTTSVADAKTTLVVSVAGNEALLPEQLESLTTALEKAFPDRAVQLSSSQLVAPFIGREMLTNGVLAILIASVLIILYVWFSFRQISGPSAGVMALIALFHDILLAFFAFVVMRTPLNESVVAVVLTILGFSINDTIVIYDRIRENVRLTNGGMPLSDLVDMSIRQSLTRSLNTSLCTFGAVAVAYVFATIFGLSSIAEFALPMMIGIISGSYSTIFLAGPLWVAWKTRGGRTGYEA